MATGTHLGGWTLGLDLGTRSVGWAAVCTENGQPVRLLACGVRVFDAGVRGDIETGRTEPPGQHRRLARQARRQTERRRRRLLKVFRCLQRARLLPPGEDRAAILHAIDREAFARFAREVNDPRERHRIAQVVPYLLRKAALDQPLPPHELGRALYHLAQRRGFLSNRKSDSEESDGEVRRGITRLAEEMEEAGARTLGEYFASLDPLAEGGRIRNRWTSREMYRKEFELIWRCQQEYHPGLLTEELHDELSSAIFHQRPLKSVKGLVGRCQLEPGHARAAWARVEAQRFRMLEYLNHTRIIDLETGEIRPFTEEERRTLIAALDEGGDITFARAKKLLGFSSKQVAFNREDAGEKRFPGNRTFARIAKAIGAAWALLGEAEKMRLAEDVISIQKEETLRKRGRRVWGLDEETARALAAVQLEPGYCRLSSKAIRTLLPLLEDGLSFSEAKKQLYPEVERRRRFELLPPVETAFPELRNPVVHRTLTELRKVVNGLLKRHGLPAAVRIELARDLKATPRERKRWQENAREHERRRQRAARLIMEEAGIAQPTPHDILKVRLWEECGGVCPYTGRAISIRSLVGPESEFDVEHIIPFSRSFDDSFANKTLCWNQENRRKGNRTPWEAYGSDPERYEQILERVRHFQGPLRTVKLERFRMCDAKEIEDLRTSQLNDTRYASVLAMEYLGLLYGGVVDEAHTRRVAASKGQVTAILRRAWDLNTLLSARGVKAREDHRHHAVDAVVLASMSQAHVHRISELAARRTPGSRLVFHDVPEPWPGFRESVAESIGGIVVSHRVSKKVRGPLHEETVYSPPRDDAGRPVVHYRKAVHTLSPGEVEAIVDRAVRAAVVSKLNALGGVTPNAIKRLESEPPYRRGGRGPDVPVRKVRIAKTVRTVAVGDGAAPRHVAPGANHHVEIFAGPAKGSTTRWIGRMVTLLEAADRVRRGLPVVDRLHPEGYEFVMTLARNEVVELTDERGGVSLYRVVTTTEQNQGHIVIDIQPVAEARPRKGAERRGLRLAVDVLRRRGCRKVAVTPLGEVIDARD